MGRPLETLLATWGISLILIQAVRTIFGAQNVQVENPAWMSAAFRCCRTSCFRTVASSSSALRRPWSRWSGSC
jgi:branched-subunit amino acid ABC-type transport system permease component